MTAAPLSVTLARAPMCCAQCGADEREPHRLLETDCVLEHDDHTERHVGRLCKRHFGRLVDTLRQLEELLALLPELVEPDSGATDGRGGTRVGSPAPGRLDVMAVTDRRATEWIGDDDAVPDIVGDLEAWLRLVDEEHPSQLLPFAAAAFAVDGRGCVAPAAEAVHWRIPWSVTLRLLHRERHWIARQPWIDDYAHDLEAFHRVLAHATRAGMWPQPIGSCPNCGTKLYNDTSGADVVTCRRCRSSWSGVHYLRLRLVLEQEAK